MTTNKSNLTSSGSMKIAGGEYADIRVSASLKSEGDLSCDSLHCSGSAKFEAALRCAGEVACSGSMKVEGAAQIDSGRFSGSLVCEKGLQVAQALRCSGSVKIGGTLHCGSIALSGSCKIVGALTAQTVDCSGNLEVNSGVEAEQFSSSGRLDIHGLLNADHISIELNGSGEVEDVGGGVIAVRQGPWNRRGGKLEAHSIEGDSIHLENTQARIVRGRDIYIGKGCEIERVEYSGSLNIVDGLVREQVQVL